MNLKRKKVCLACTVTYFKVTFTTFRNILRTIFIFSISMIMFLDSAPTKSDVVNWYLEEISGDIESQEELLEKKLIVEKVGTAIPYLQTELCAELEPAGLRSRPTFGRLRIRIKILAAPAPATLVMLWYY